MCVWHYLHFCFLFFSKKFLLLFFEVYSATEQSRAVDEPWCHGEAWRRRIVSGAEEGNYSSGKRWRPQDEQGLRILPSTAAAAAAVTDAAGGSCGGRGRDGGGNRRPRLRRVLPPAEAPNLPGTHAHTPCAFSDRSLTNGIECTLRSMRRIELVIDWIHGWTHPLIRSTSPATNPHSYPSCRVPKAAWSFGATFRAAEGDCTSSVYSVHQHTRTEDEWHSNYVLFGYM